MGDKNPVYVRLTVILSGRPLPFQTPELVRDGVAQILRTHLNPDFASDVEVELEESTG
jgi:hypothetical protein